MSITKHPTDLLKCFVKFVNLISGSQFPISHGLKSCTTEVMATKPFLVNGHPVILLDTPGFDDTNERDTDILAEIATTLAATYVLPV
jgi:hypothetical protein